MITKRIAALAALSALISTAAPAFAANPSVTVEWNTQSVSTIALYTQATTAHTHSAAADTIYANANTGSGSCAASDTEATTGTVNFGNVTPDGTTFYTDCLEPDAVDAYVVSTDPKGYSITETETGAPANYDVAANGALVCILPDGAAGGGAYATGVTGSNFFTGRTAAPSIVSTTACPAGDFIVSSGTTTVVSNTGTGTPSLATAGSDWNSDMELVLAPQATSSGSVSTMTVTYTLTPG